MEMHSVPPSWLEIIGWISLVVAFASLLIILFDIYKRGHRQHMKIMEAVYAITALYFGPFALWFYYKYGRATSIETMRGQQHGAQSNDVIHWYQTAESVFHCGAGCTLGDIVGGWIVFALGLTIAGHSMYVDFIFDFVLAWSLGIIFQYFTIVPMRPGLGKLEGLRQAITADTLSIISFQVGLFVGMFIYQMLIFQYPLAKTTSSYWLLMQLSMILGFFTAYPVNYLLVKSGIKENCS